jgi:2-polyprenyl-3-methyl-5-hydroxy-6-metoxy-1,4-benzoquinol methylase
MSDSCIVCGSRDSIFLFEKNGYLIKNCKSCGFKYVDEKPDEGFTRSFYTDDFFKAGHDKYGYADYLGEKPNLMRWNAKKLSFVEQYVRGGAILDVGCAAGFFLEALGPSWDRYGCEASTAMARIAREKFGDRVTETAFEQYEPGRQFDVITMWDLIEHLVDPVGCMRKVRSLLKEDGFLFIGTPDSASPVVHILGKHWYHYIPPTHLHYFSRWNIPTFLNNNGFDMKRLIYFGKHVTLAEILLDLSYMLRAQGLRRLSERVALRPSWNRSIPYMAFDDMVVMARKTPSDENDSE